MRVHISIMVVAGALLAACGRQPSIDEEMKRDLEAASAGSIELAPSGGQKVVSAIELAPQAKPQVTKARPAQAPARTPPRVTLQTTTAAPEPAAPRPSSAPKVSPPPPGGYKSVGEVIRNAPFPIKP
jgi:hypothetical protein